MKKILRIVLIFIGSLFLLLLVLPFLFRGKIEEKVKVEINRQVEARVDWDRFGMNFFRGFPDLSVNLHGLSVVGVDPFDGDTLLGLERFEFRVNPLGVFGKNVEVKHIILHRPLIRALVLEDGRANWDIVPESGEEEPEVEEESSGSGTDFGVRLKKFLIEGGRVQYADRAGDVEASLDGVDFRLSGDLSLEETRLDLGLSVGAIQASLGGISYMKDGELAVDVLLDAFLNEGRYVLAKNEMRLNDLRLGLTGEVILAEDGAMDMDLAFASVDNRFSSLLSLVPALYLQDFQGLETRGTLSLEGAVKGRMQDSLLPDARISLTVADGFFSYPDLPKDVSDVQIALVADYKGSDMDQSRVDLQTFHLLLGGNPFDLGLTVTHPVSDMEVRGKAVGRIDFSTLRDVVPMEGLELQGVLSTDLRWDTRMSVIEAERYEEVDLDGSLAIEGLEVNGADLPVPVNMERMALVFTPRHVSLDQLDLSLGKSDVHFTGKLYNFIPYVFAGDTLGGEVTVWSTLLDANELMPESPADTLAEPDAGGEEEMAAAPPDSSAVAGGMKIPENIDFRMQLDVKDVRYDPILVKNIRGSMGVSRGVAHLDELTLEVIEGTVIYFRHCGHTA
ncbi:MAG: AsmA family protein [Bacteroidales bacterium]